MAMRDFTASLPPDAAAILLRGGRPRVRLTPIAYGKGRFLTSAEEIVKTSSAWGRNYVTPRQARRRAIRNEMAAMSRERNRKR
jgi:hypothetical protein